MDLQTIAIITLAILAVLFIISRPDRKPGQVIQFLKEEQRRVDRIQQEAIRQTEEFKRAKAEYDAKHKKNADRIKSNSKPDSDDSSSN